MMVLIHQTAERGRSKQNQLFVLFYHRNMFVCRIFLIRFYRLLLLEELKSDMMIIIINNNNNIAETEIN